MKRLLLALILLGSIVLPACSKTDIYVVAVGIADYPPPRGKYKIECVPDQGGSGITYLAIWIIVLSVRH